MVSKTNDIKISYRNKSFKISGIDIEPFIQWLEKEFETCPESEDIRDFVKEYRKLNKFVVLSKSQNQILTDKHESIVTTQNEADPQLEETEDTPAEQSVLLEPLYCRRCGAVDSDYKDQKKWAVFDSFWYILCKNCNNRISLPLPEDSIIRTTRNIS